MIFFINNKYVNNTKKNSKEQIIKLTSLKEKHFSINNGLKMSDNFILRGCRAVLFLTALASDMSIYTAPIWPPKKTPVKTELTS